MVGVPMTTGNPDAAACIASCSASILDRVYGPGMAWTGSIMSCALASTDGEERKRMDSVEQCRNRAMPRLRAAAMTTSVPRQLTA